MVNHQKMNQPTLVSNVQFHLIFLYQSFYEQTAPYLNVPEGSSVAQVQVSNDNSAGGQGRPQGSGQLYIGGSYITDS